MIRTVVVVADSEAPHPAVRDMSTKEKKKEITFFFLPIMPITRDGKKAKGKSKTPFFLAGVAWMNTCIRAFAMQRSKGAGWG